MSAAPATPDRSPGDAVSQDLALVLPAGAAPLAATATSPVSEPDFATAANWLRQSRAPAIAGLGTLSIEACRHAIALAETVRGRLLPWPLPADASHDAMSVMQTATLGHIYASEMIIWVGCTGNDGPIAQAIAANQLLAAFVRADLDTVLRLRAELGANPKAEPIGRYQRVGVVLGPGVDVRVASQWHKLAAQVQQQTRMAVIGLPDLATHQNLRGALEVITWQTGLSARTGGVDFGDGTPRACADLPTLLRLGAIDLLIDTLPADVSASLQGHVGRRIIVGPKVAATGITADQTLHLPTRTLGAGSASRVMRFDGAILWASADPANALPDLAKTLFSGLTEIVRSGA